MSAQNNNSGMFNEWDNVVSTGRNELVFADRNKEYGAYQLRKHYNRNVTLALLITVAAFFIAVSIPKIIELLTPTEEQVEVPVTISQVDLEPPPTDETEPPPPPPPPPPPVMETVKFTPPVVVDEELKDEELPPPQEKLSETNVGVTTQEGSGEEIIIPTEGTGNEVVEETNEVFMSVEEMPVFPGGEAALFGYLGKNIQYPQMEKENGISGTVYVYFVINKQGKVEDVKVVRGVKGGPGLEKEAIRVVKNMPDWAPGKQNGRAVKVQYTIPVKFLLK